MGVYGLIVLECLNGAQEIREGAQFIVDFIMTDKLYLQEVVCGF